MKMVKRQDPIQVAQGTTESVFKTGNSIYGGQYRFSVVGAGTADIQPVFGTNTTHKPETVTNDTVVLDIYGATNYDISASGGDITVYFTVLGPT